MVVVADRLWSPGDFLMVLSPSSPAGPRGLLVMSSCSTVVMVCWLISSWSPGGLLAALDIGYLGLLGSGGALGLLSRDVLQVAEETPSWALGAKLVWGRPRTTTLLLASLGQRLTQDDSSWLLLSD